MWIALTVMFFVWFDQSIKEEKVTHDGVEIEITPEMRKVIKNLK